MDERLTIEETTVQLAQLLLAEARELGERCELPPLEAMVARLYLEVLKVHSHCDKLQEAIDKMLAEGCAK